MKTVSIDDLLASKSLSLTLAGKTYIVRDVPDEVFQYHKDSEGGDLKAVLAKTLGCTIDDLAEISTYTLQMVMREIIKNFFSPESSA